MKYRATILVAVTLFLASCSGVRSNAVIPVQSKDKELTCKEIILEINEAEQYMVAAEKNKDSDIRTFIAPIGYMFTVSSANEAIAASEKRITYLKDVYRISGCSAGASRLNEKQLRGHTFGAPRPAQQQYQPQGYPPQQYRQPLPPRPY